MFTCNIVNKFLHNYCFSYSSTSEETHLSSFEHRCDEINYFDTCFKNLSLRREFFKSWGFSMNWVTSFYFWCIHIIDWISEYIEHTTKNHISNRYRYRSSRSYYSQSSAYTIYWIHRYCSYDSITKLLLYFKYKSDRSSLDLECLIYLRDISSIELNINNDTNNFCDYTCMSHKIIIRNVI